MKKRRFKKVMSLLVVFLLIASVLPAFSITARADNSNTMPAADLMAVLAGDFVEDQGLGNNWNPRNTGTIMKEYSKGIYELTLGFKTAKAYAYKVAFNGQWNSPAALGDSGNNKALKVATPGKVTFKVDAEAGKVYDTINDPTQFKASAALTGTLAQAGGGDWTPGDGKYIYGNYFKAGTYQYKGIENYSWEGGGIPNSGNIDITVPDDGNGGKYVVFIADRVNKTIIDSINKPDNVAVSLGLQAPVLQVESPVINPNGTITFDYKDDSAKAVYLAGTMNGWNTAATPMSKDSNGIWTVTLRLGDSAVDGSYKFVADGNWLTDPANTAALDKDGNSTFSLPAYSGRKVVLAGDIQSVVGEGNWAPGSEKTRFHYDGNGCYSLTIPNVPAGDYQYKIAMGSWDPENYGADGKSYGDNIKFTVPVKQAVTFYYNDDSHFVVNSVNYPKLDIQLTGTGIPDGTKLQDVLLTGIYKASVTLNNGTYNDIKAVVNDKEYSFAPIEVIDSSKVVTFSFEPKTRMIFTDISSSKVNINSLYFNSRETQYKSPYGAVKSGDTISFNLRAAKGDLVAARLVIDTPDGTQTIDMTKNGTFDYDKNGEFDRWTAQYTPASINMYKYYFVVSNGSDVKAYGDYTGYYGAGKGADLGMVGKYGFNVYDPNYKTPDWMKNAVVYQIFPDRFFNGDPSNDYRQKLARGTVPYEFYPNWYSLPEDPGIEFLKDSSGNKILDKDGKPEVDPNYTGTKGDGIYSDEMYGGDLKGIQDKLDYLKALGVNTLYINPISKSVSNHRYDTTDYKHVDPLLGYDEDFANLTKEASKRGMHIILDGVFNHVSDDSVYFDRYGKYAAKGEPLGAYQYWSKVYDAMNTRGLNQQEAEKQVTAYFADMGITDLHYKDWFVINNKRVAAADNDPEHYEYAGWWGYDSLPVIQNPNGSEYNVKSWDEEIIDGPEADSRQWLENGSSGWRIDVANEVADDVWPHFRKAVKDEGDKVIIGEIWDDASKYLLGDKFDSVMNYRFRNAVLDFVSANNVDTVKVMNELELVREEYPKEAFEAMLNLVDSHDTERILSRIDGETSPYAPAATAGAKAKVRLVPLFQMTYPGAPCIYYGDEAGMVGGLDPDCRRGMIWGEGDKDQVEWYATLANIRDSYPVLRTGDLVPITVPSGNSADVMAYLREDGTNHALVAINRKDSNITGLTLSVPSVPDGTILTNALKPSETYTVSNGSVTINVPGLSGGILVEKYTAVDIDTDELKDAYDPSFIVPDRKVVEKNLQK